MSGLGPEIGEALRAMDALVGQVAEPMDETDEGAVHMAVGVRDGVLVIQFGSPVAWVGLGRAEVMALIAMLHKHLGGLR